jgi:hypothetical protein
MIAQPGPYVTLPKSGALAKYLRVKMDAGVLALCDATDREAGTTKETYLASGLGVTNFAAVLSPRAPGTCKMIASAAVTQFATVYGASAGRVSSSSNSNPIGIALTAASTAGDEIEVLRQDLGLAAPTAVADDITVAWGTGTDVVALWSTGDASNHAFVLGLGDTNQAFHITDAAASGTDWNIAATTHPNIYIHSNTTPATDYLRLGGHDGTLAYIDVVGGTTLHMQIAATTAVSVTATALTLATGVLLTQTDGCAKIGATAHGQITTGLCIDQAGADNILLACKSTGDVATGLTTIVTGTVETADVFTVSKFAAATGGALIQALGENAAVTTNLRIESYGGQADATHSAAGRGLVEIYASQHDGANALSDIGADGNAFAVIGRRGTADATLFIVDEDGEIHSDVTLNVFDEHDDVTVCRAFDMVGERKGFVKSAWDKYVVANEAKLVELGILGATIKEGGLVNHNRLMQLHNGAIWQLFTDLMEVVKALPESVRSALPERIQSKLTAA